MAGTPSCGWWRTSGLKVQFCSSRLVFSASRFFSCSLTSMEYSRSWIG